jgi:hypothetical protein
MKSKKIIAGLDVLKFIMALLIVDIHVKGSLILPPPNFTASNLSNRRSSSSYVFRNICIFVLF